MNSDDYVNENFLGYLINFIEYNKYKDAVAVDYYLVNENEEILERLLFRKTYWLWYYF